MVVHFTFRSVVTRIRRGARILALVVDAGTIRRTVGVGAATHQDAGNFGIAQGTWRTLADGTMVGGVACGFGSAGGTIGRACWYALTVDARVLFGTLVVASASYSGAFYIRISVEALLARADWFVVLDPAVGVGSAATRVPAYVVDAGAVVETFGIGKTSHLADWCYWVASSASAAYVAYRADANHGSYG